MSRLEIRLSPLAQNDLIDILQYTLENWGETQMDAYAEQLSNGLKLLSQNPEIGTARDDWFPGCRCFQTESHLVLYDIAPSQLRIARIFHRRMDVDGRFN